MRSFLSRGLFLSTLVISLVVSLPSLPVSYACSPAPNGYVFNDTIQADAASLPDGVTVTHESLYLLTFVNESLDTVYALADPTLLRDGWPVVETPQELEALMPADQVIAFELEPSASFELGRSDTFFPDFNPDQYFDYNMPEQFEGLPVPDPLETRIAMIAGGELYDVPVAISYDYNPDYDPMGYQKGIESCAEFDASVAQQSRGVSVLGGALVISVALCGILVALAGGAGLAVFLMRRRA